MDDAELFNVIMVFDNGKGRTEVSFHADAPWPEGKQLGGS